MSIGKRIVLFLLTAVLITVFILYFGQTLLEVLTPILLAAIQAYLFLPFIKPLEKRTNRSAAIILGFAILTVVNIAALVILVPVFVEQIKAFSIVVPQYIENLSVLIEQYTQPVSSLGINLENFTLIGGIAKGIEDTLASFSPAMIISIVTTSFLIPVIMYYMLKDREKIKRIMLFLMPENIRTPAFFMFKNINRQLRDYIMGEFMIILLVSALMALALALFGFEYWLILGIIMGILNIIPYIGPVLGSVPILLIAAISGWDRFWLALILIVVVQQIDNLVIQPHIIANSVKIHPVIVLVCVIAGNSIGNLIGMVLAIPAYIILRIMFKEFYKYFTERKRKFPQLTRI